MSKYDHLFENIKQSSSKYKQNFLEFTYKSLQQFLDLNPNHVGATHLLSDVLVAQKKIYNALELLENFYSIKPDAARPRLIKVLLTIAINCPDEDEQLILYKRVFELDAEQLEAKNAWHKILQQREKTTFQPTISNPVTEQIIISNHDQLQPDVQLAELSHHALKILETENRETTHSLFAKMTELESAYEKLDPSLNLNVAGSDILNIIKTMHHYASELIQTRQQEKKLTQLISIEREARLQNEQELATFTQQINDDKNLIAKNKTYGSQITKLTSDIGIKEHSLQQIKTTLIEREQDLKQAKQMEESLMQHIRVQDDKLAQLNKQKEQLQTKLKKQSLGFDELVQDNNNNNEQHQHNIKEIALLTKELDIQKYDLQQVKTILKQREQELIQYNNENKALTQITQQQTVDLAQLKQDKEQFEQQLVVKTIAFDEYVQTKKEESEQSQSGITQLKQEKEQFEQQLVAKTTAFDEYVQTKTDELKKSQSDITQLKQEKEQFEQQLVAKTTAFDEYVQTKTDESKKSQSDITQLKQEIELKKQILQKTENALTENEQSLVKSCQKEQNLTQQVKLQNNNLSQINAKVEQLTQEIVVKDQIIQKVENSFAQTKHNLETTDSEVQNLTQQIQTKDNFVQELNEQKDQLTQQLSEKTIAFKELAKYKQEGLEQYQQDIFKLNTELDDKKTVLHNTENQLVQVQSTSNKTSVVNKILVMVSLVLGVVIWWLLQKPPEVIVREISVPIVSKVKIPEPTIMQPIVIIPKQSPVTINVEKAMPKVRNFCIYFKDKSWISIIDKKGDKLFEGSKMAGDYMHLQESPSRIRVGNISAVFIESDCDMRQVTNYSRESGSNHVFIMD